MKANRVGREDGPEREALRAFLRQWRVGTPPPDLEEDLRRTFRRRRSGRRPVVWAALAAGIALAVLSLVLPTRRPTAPDRPVAVVSPEPAPTVPPGSSPAVSGTRIAAASNAPRPHGRPAPLRSLTEPEVIVEPGQAQLLRQLGRELRTVQQEAPRTAPLPIETVAADAPEAPVPRMPETDAPAYRVAWETVEGVWPFIHRAVPGSGR
jgi:hypothetical protein